MAATLRRAFSLLREAYDKFCADGCTRVGAALAYYFFFSLFPLLLLLVSAGSYLLASGVPVLVNARSYVLARASDLMPRAGELLERSIDAALAARGQTGAVGVLTLLWSASNVFTQLYQAFNVIWGCCPAPSVRAAIRTKLTAIAVVLGISLLLLASMIADTALAVAARRAPLVPGWQRVWARLAPLSSALMATAVFGLLYRYLPNGRSRWRFIWPGALLAGVAWELLRQAFTVYTTRYANYAAVYGAVGGTIALLTWIYLSAQVVFFGAEFSVVYERHLGRRQALGHESRAASTPASLAPPKPGGVGSEA